MNFIDTHIHLYSKDYHNDREALLEKAMANGVKKFYLPNIDSESIDAMLLLEQQHPDSCIAMMGLHPCSVDANVDKELKIVENWLAKRPFAAIGEIGIDLYWDKTWLPQQIMAFKTQIEWALAYNYPIVIHCREAFDPIYEVLSGFSQLPKGIFHCFSGTLGQANKILELGGFKLGIGGVITFKNAGLDKVIAQIDAQHLVLETDAPYLAPVPFRGKRNEPVYLLEVAKKVAELKSLSMDELAQITSQNAAFIFGA